MPPTPEDLLPVGASGRRPARVSVLLAWVVVALIYLTGVTGQWWPSPDSALYLGLGRSLAEGHGYQFNGEVCNFIPPVLPGILAGLRWAFGESFWWPNLFVALCGLAAFGMIFAALARMGDPRTALIVALATALSYVFYFNAHMVLTDVPFAALFWASAYCAARLRHGSRWWALSMVLLAILSVSVRAPGLILVIVLGIGLVLDGLASAGRRRRLWAGAGILSGMGGVGAGLLVLGRLAGRTTPLYARVVAAHVRIGLGGHLRQLAEGLQRMPSVLAEFLTSQSGAVPLGILVGGLMVWGLIVLIRRRQWLIPTMVVLYPIALVLAVGSRSIRPRYLLAIQPVLLLAILEGLWALVRLCGRRRGLGVSPTRHFRTMLIAGGLIVLANGPRVFRNAFYHRWLSGTERYYRTVRDGQFEELFQVTGLLRSSGLRAGPAGVEADKVSILHYLSRRRTVALPSNDRITAADAEAIHTFAVAHPELTGFVLNIGEGQTVFLETLKARFGRTAGLIRVHSGKHYQVYARSPAPVSGAPAAPSRPGAGREGSSAGPRSTGSGPGSRPAGRPAGASTRP